MNFQLYRGNLHKVPDVPRRWPLSKPSISLLVFKQAIAKRREALLAEQKVQGEQGCVPEDSQASDHEHDRKRKRQAEVSVVDMEADENLPCVSERKARTCSEADLLMTEDMAVGGADDMACGPSRGLHSTFDAPVKAEEEDDEMAGNDTEKIVTTGDDCNLEKEGERLEAPRTPAAKDEDCTKSIERTQTMELDGATPCNEVPSLAKRRAEIQEQLKQLQETKHQLVQILKQVLITEEESKRKNQGLLQYSAPYAMVGTGDLPLDQKMGSDMQSADLEEGELDCTRNPGPPAVVSSYGSHSFDVHPQTPGAAPARHFNHQQLNKP
ncbi:hypothetical protein GOP47_0012650 [Adiantum capillus-veneris]|uniref:Uncharacterized protein n=1 Tax=Adiantum capillus-veneris TaxID=13818 RepID=A0A9D4UR32_ADICA|nr:hypothetical protein GOP47_0012650 [Adiantum capillus-veneris]